MKPIETEADYKTALKEISPYFDNEPDLGSDESTRFEILALLIEAYESKNFPIDPPDPAEAIKFRGEQEEPVISHITPAGGNIFADLGFEPDEAARLLAESDARIDAELAAKGRSARRRR